MNIQLSLKDFTWDPFSRTLFAEVSELPLPFGCPLHFTVKSPYTGKVIQFYADSIDSDASGEDVMGWKYKALDSDIRILIIND